MFKSCLQSWKHSVSMLSNMVALATCGYQESEMWQVRLGSEFYILFHFHSFKQPRVAGWLVVIVLDGAGAHSCLAMDCQLRKRLTVPGFADGLLPKTYTGPGT